MGEMIASIGHQWRQPLNSLSLTIQDVREEFEFGQLDEIYINNFTKESMIQIKHMSRTINDFRKFYKPNNEKSPFQLEVPLRMPCLFFHQVSNIMELSWNLNTAVNLWHLGIQTNIVKWC